MLGNIMTLIFFNKNIKESFFSYLCQYDYYSLVEVFFGKNIMLFSKNMILNCYTVDISNISKWIIEWRYLRRNKNNFKNTSVFYSSNDKFVEYITLITNLKPSQTTLDLSIYPSIVNLKLKIKGEVIPERFDFRVPHISQTVFFSNYTIDEIHYYDYLHGGLIDKIKTTQAI